MRRVLLSFILLLCVNVLYSQQNAEVGFYGGVSYYLGDINPKKMFYSSNVCVGALYRYNLNSRYAIRASMTFSDLSADDRDFDNLHQQSRLNSFSTEIVDFAMLLEFNFQDFLMPKKSYTEKICPFVAVGLGYVSSVGTSSSLTIPFALGAKIVLAPRWGASVEWSFRKTFTDNLDALSDPYKFNKNSLFYNNDWISSVGVSITYRIFPDDADCRFYDSYIK